jgi:hypothetical protein
MFTAKTSRRDPTEPRQQSYKFGRGIGANLQPGQRPLPLYGLLLRGWLSFNSKWMGGTVKIIELSASGFARLKAVEIRPDNDPVVQILRTALDAAREHCDQVPF